MISIVIPTKNEEANIRQLLDGLRNAPWRNKGIEVIVVDDSSDKTAEIAEVLHAKVVKGQGKGLGQAIVDGIGASNGEVVVVMDADLSHDPHTVPSLVSPILEDGYDMTIGSRYVAGGNTVGWEFSRRVISRCACLLALPVTTVKDATSGFFAIRKSILDEVKLEASSWKIMLEVLLKAKPARVTEVPISFVVRQEGKSKFDKKQMIAYLKHLGLLAFWKYQRFLKFCIVGGTGALITFILTWLLTEALGFWYMFSLVFAVLIATVSNYTLNSMWTYKLAEDPSSPDYEWRAFFRGSIVQKWWKQSIAKTVWNWMPNASKMLDVGCGSSPIITNYYGDVTGIDRNRAKLEFMRQKCPRHNFTDHSIHSFGSKEFDHVICIEVLEHLTDPEMMIAEISRVVKDDGRVILATPDYNKKLWHFAEMFTPYKEEHVVQFTKKSLEELCKQHSLFPVRHKYIAGCDLVEEFEKVPCVK